MGHTQRKNGSKRMLSTDDNMKLHTRVSLSTEGKANGKTTGVSESAPAPANLVGMSIEFPNEKIETGAVSIGSSAATGSTFRGLVQNEKQLIRERRKQANRESARKSRLKKQAEMEELRRKYGYLDVENKALKTELVNLKAYSDKLRLENAALTEKLKNTQVGKQEGMVGAEIQAALSLPNSYVNGLNSDSASGNVHWESENHEKSDSRTKHHQLKTNFRADAVAAG
ncbi:hypothetical protein FH972_012865 [Carpinus fangiana]|uniref:BZIP domain-containing protein n=1 Tax=Carpinus fangiana TaxID=176857 RepID=A0A5N6R8G0_9ROSI|nr:hypothetical protein FH972_012865 [Carpinus fangiana]